MVSGAAQYSFAAVPYPTALQAETAFYQAWISQYQKTACGFSQLTWQELDIALNGWIPTSPDCGGGHVLPVVLPKILTCPANATVRSAACTCDNGFKPNSANTACVSECPIQPLAALDAGVQPYENGLIDLDNLTPSTRDGAACIVREARLSTPRIRADIRSGYRPPAYQTHLREVYDKWQLIKNNNDAVCADIKQAISTEFNNHGMVYQPGIISRHSSGVAVDISLSDYGVADNLANRCAVPGGGAMSRPIANDRVHFESPR